MNIFNLPLEEAEKEIDKMIKSVPREQLIKDLKECGLMNKQDKKEIMNLIKYKKMLGGRRMNLEKAKIKLANWAVGIDFNTITSNEAKKELLEDISEAIKTVLKELHTLQTNYKLLEEKFDGSAEEKVDKLTEELDKQKQVKAEMRKVAWEEGYNQGYLEGAMRAFKEVK